MIKFPRLSKRMKAIVIPLFFFFLIPILVYFISNRTSSFDLRSLASEFITGSTSTTQNKCSLPSAKESTLSEYAKERDINVGTLLSECFKETNTDKEKCKQTIVKEYPGMMLQVQDQWRSSETVRGSYNFTKLDENINFAKNNDLKIHFFHLIWTNSGRNQFTPKWLFPGEDQCGNWSKQELLNIMKTHIQSMIQHNSDTVVAWNVVNEAFTGSGANGYYIHDCFYEIIGPEYIDKAFIYAREATPNGLLVLNEPFGQDRMKRDKIDAFFSYVKSAKSRGIPIDAVGLQNHLLSKSGGQFSQGYLDDLSYYFQKAKDANVKVLITEMDVYQAGHTQSDVATVYKNVLAICLENKNCISFGTWGISDKYSWLRVGSPNLADAEPLLFDTTYQRKQSFYGLMDALRENTSRKCSTNEVLDTTPTLNTGYWDKFQGDALNGEHWNEYKSSTDVKISETTYGNLNIAIPQGSNNGKAKYGGIVFRNSIPSDSDFRVIASMYKPVIQGSGTAITGIAFNPSDDDEGNAVRVFWRSTSSTSELVMTMKNGTQTTEINRISVDAQKINLRLVRAGQTYIARYQIAGDDDNPLINIGIIENSSLSPNGKIKIFANNLGKNNQFPSIKSRVDTIGVSWFDNNLPQKSIIYDTFSSLKINEERWNIHTPDGTTAKIELADNLALSVVSGSNNGQARISSITTKDSIVEGKDFIATTQILKPIVDGSGTGKTGFQYFTNDLQNKEQVTIVWAVTQNTSSLIFTAQDSNGKTISWETVDLEENVTKVHLRISRTQDGYIAMYKNKISDDIPFIKLGQKVLIENSSKGRFKLFTSNVGSNGKFPSIKGRFDVFSLSYFE